MSTLQLSLVITGALVLALIVGWNAWSAQRNAPRRARQRTDPGLRQEPGFDGAAAALLPGADPAHGGAADSASPTPLPSDAIIGPDADTSASTTGQALLAAQAAHERRHALDALIDALAALQPEHPPVSGEAAQAALPTTRRAGSKPFAIEGRNQETGQWEPPVPGQRYQNFQAGVQLTNRMGALNEIEFSEFVVKTQGFADAINATPDFPDMLQEVARARELDQFASTHDAQLAFTLRARQAAWSPGYLQQNAARLGFVAGTLPGRLVLPAASPGQAPLLTLAYDTQAALADDPEQSAVREITLSLDVAQVPRSEQPFQRLRSAADALCKAMDGRLCDQNGQILPAMAMDPIAADLEQLYDQLDARNLSAGSVLARRLFS